MAFVTRYNIEKLGRYGQALYLTHIYGVGLEWTTDADEALEYSDEEEANDDAEAFGGDVVSFQRFSKFADPVHEVAPTLIAAE